MYWRWWEQARIQLEGAKKRAAEAEMGLESDSDSDSGGEERSQVEQVSQVERIGLEWKNKCP